MTDLVVDLGSLPDDVREKLAELDLELSEGNCTHHRNQFIDIENHLNHASCMQKAIFVFVSLSLCLCPSWASIGVLANILACQCFGMIVVMRAPKTILLRAVKTMYGNFEIIAFV